jgi:ATP-dependent RNA helicase RhlE
VTPVASTVERIAQRVIQLDHSAKPAVLAELLNADQVGRALVFTRTKHGADKVVKGLERAGIPSQAIHGNKSQNHRERTLAAFRSGEIRTLVATDIAARGIDVDGITHVVNFDLPNIPETYVHRIGRTARAGAEGAAISLCSGEENGYLRDIERLIRISLPREDRRTGKDQGPREAAPARQQQRNGRPPQRNGGAHKSNAGAPPNAAKPSRRRHRSGAKSGAANNTQSPHQPAHNAGSGVQGVAFLRRPADKRGPRTQAH